MATSVSSKGTNNFSLNKASADSAIPKFLGKSVSIAKNVLLFVAGAVFFPVVSIVAAIHVYRASSTSDSRTRTSASIVRAILTPIPILGGIVHISAKLLHYFKKDSIFAISSSSESGFLVSTLLSIPFVGAGIIAIFLTMNVDNE